MEPALTTADDLAAKMHDVMTLDDAEIARLKRVAASGKVYDAEGQDERREAAHRLWLHYSARPEGTRLKEGQMKNEARDWSGGIFYLIRPACDRHPETCWEQYKLCSQAEEKEAERIGVLRTRVASVEFKFLRFAEDGGLFELRTFFTLYDKLLNKCMNISIIKIVLRNHLLAREPFRS